MADSYGLVEVLRGSHVESTHRYIACAAEPDGRVALSYGDPETPVFLRSLAKPFIAAAVVLSGAADAFHFDDRELAIIAGSHVGDEIHILAVRSILGKIGLGEDALLCGPDEPERRSVAEAVLRSGKPFTAIHNNCSGNHAGLLALCRVLNAPISEYLAFDHPVQRFIIDLCARIFDLDIDHIEWAVDGCGIPTLRCPLRNAAVSFARLASLEAMAKADADAVERVRKAMVAQPDYIRGRSFFDTDLMIADQGMTVPKIGAEGTHGDAIVLRGLGLAVKILDGNSRATPPAVIALLDELGVLTGEMRRDLARYAEAPVLNAAGARVGHVSMARAAAIMGDR